MSAKNPGTKLTNLHRIQRNIVITAPALYSSNGRGQSLTEKIDVKIDQGWEIVGRPTKWIGEYGVICWKAVMRYKEEKK